MPARPAAPGCAVRPRPPASCGPSSPPTRWPAEGRPPRRRSAWPPSGPPPTRCSSGPGVGPRSSRTGRPASASAARPPRSRTHSPYSCSRSREVTKILILGAAASRSAITAEVGDEVLGVVQDHQQLAVGHEVDHVLTRRQLERFVQRAQDLPVVRERLERHPDDPVGEPEPGRRLDGQPRLAGAAETDQRQQPAVEALQPGTNLFELLAATDQRCHRGGQRGAGRWCARPRRAPAVRD